MTAYRNDGERVLDDLHAALTDYVALPSVAAGHAVTLWITATHCLAAFDHATRLVVKSPEKRCGKTRLLEIVAGTCRKPMMTANVSEAVVFRSIGDEPPVLLLDEADAMFGTKIKAEQNEGLRGLLNAGHRRGWPVYRTVGAQHTPTAFPSFAMACLAGIGNLPDTIEDRAVIITMRRRAEHEHIHPYRLRRDGPRLDELRVRVESWSAKAIDTFREPEMALGDGTILEDREADSWEPLLIVADAAGGHWPDRARAAALLMTRAAASADSERSTGVRLLADVAAVVRDRTFIGSQELVDGLRGLPEAPWAGYELTVRKLAQRLKRYGVHPSTDPAKIMRGYKAEHLADPFARYLPRSKRPDESKRPDTPETLAILPDAYEPPDTSKCPDPDKRPGETSDYRLPADTWTVADASLTGATLTIEQSELYRCPLCGTQTRPSSTGHPSLCRRCTLAELDTRTDATRKGESA